MIKNKTKIFLILILIAAVGIVGNALFKYSASSDDEDNLINISSLPESFIENYLDEYSQIKSEADKENMLIVTSLSGIADSYGASNIIEAPNHQYFLQYDSALARDQALDRFRTDDTIANVDVNAAVELYGDYHSWGIEAMALDQAGAVIDSATTFPEVRVAIIDTGCDVGLIEKYYPGKIAETYNTLDSSTETMYDVHGHGTHIAGTIAEGTPSNVKIVPVKVSDGKTQFLANIIAAIDYIAYYEKADVINMSFGSEYDFATLHIAIEAASQKNIISVAASGNDNSSQTFYPAGFDNTISISSTDSQLMKSDFSNYGDTIDFAAPGTDIMSTISRDIRTPDDSPENDFGSMSGTSMATPHAASAVAILKSYNKNLTKYDAVNLLKEYAVKDLGDPGKDIYYGYGLIHFNPNSFCTDPEADACEKFGVFKVVPETPVSSLTVESILNTARNYGTVNNLNPTQIKITYTDDTTRTVKLGNLRDVEITGYDAYSTGPQTITIKWHDCQTSFQFTNPTNWASGWEYESLDDDSIKITGFIDFYSTGDETKTLYLPEIIDGHYVTELAGNDDASPFSYARATDYENIVLPSTLRAISGSQLFKRFTSIDKIYIPRNVTNISPSALTQNITIWTDADADARAYAASQSIPYETASLPTITTSLTNNQFHAFDTVEVAVSLYFDRGVYIDGIYHELKTTSGRQESVSPDDIRIVYQTSADGFHYGDTSFTVRGTTQYGEPFEQSIDVTVEPLRIAKPVQPTRQYLYDPNGTTFAIVGYDLNTMILSGGTAVNAGLHNVTISLKSPDYIWSDGTSEPVIFTYEIVPAPLVSLDPSLVLRDSKLTIQNNSFHYVSSQLTDLTSSCIYQHYNKAGEPAAADIMKTGDLIKITQGGTQVSEYRVVFLGDVSGDGKINYLDYVNVYNHIQKSKHPDSDKKSLVDEYLLAADVSGDDKVNYLDYVKIYNQIKSSKGI